MPRRGLNTIAQGSALWKWFYTTKEIGKRTGLGLATVYGIVKQSGGYIVVDSRINQGTSFEIYLPCVQEQIQTEKIPSIKKYSFDGSETILLIEDEDVVRELNRRVLVKFDYHVLEAKNGEHAIDLAKKYDEEIDLIVTDVIMPRISGPELVKQIKNVKRVRNVLYVSGYTEEAVVRYGIRDSSLSFLQKPFTPDRLVEKVRELLRTSDK